MPREAEVGRAVWEGSQIHTHLSFCFDFLEKENKQTRESMGIEAAGSPATTTSVSVNDVQVLPGKPERPII